MDSNLLAQMLEDIATTQTRIHSILVIRNGYSLVDVYNHPYTSETSVHIQSVTKTVLGMLVGKAIGEGVIKSENEKLFDYYRYRLLRNPSAQKDAIQLKDLLSMSSGLDCQEFSSTDPVREQSSDWASDPQGVTTAGYGLHLRPVELTKLAFLYLNNGKWEGQQIHVYPSKNLIVVVTASLESYSEAPEIEKMLANYILPAIRSVGPLAADAQGYSRLEAAVHTLANPLHAVAPPPDNALDISQSSYRIEENPLGWERLKFVFEVGASTAQLLLNDFAGLKIGLDQVYRLSEGDPFGALWLRGRWTGENTFGIDYPYPWGVSRLGELGETEFQFTFSGDHVQIVLRELVFGGEGLVILGAR